MTRRRTRDVLRAGDIGRANGAYCTSPAWGVQDVIASAVPLHPGGLIATTRMKSHDQLSRQSNSEYSDSGVATLWLKPPERKQLPSMPR